ncbi:MAG: hypothetical protein M1118_14335 [Chloroflexi bacterium]|nr:hypothetical protein [Chloroflexota bacterium]
MLPRRHALYGGLGALALAPILRKQSAIFLVSSVLFDVDHYLWYAMTHSDWSLRNALRFFDHVRSGNVNLNGCDARPFHGLSNVALLGALSLRWHFLRPIFLGILFHSLLDAYSENRLNPFLPLGWRNLVSKRS